MTYVCFAAPLRSMMGRQFQVGASRVRGPGRIGMLISICDEGCEAGGAEGRANEKDAIGYWQVAARQRGGVCVEISLGKLCTTLDHGTLRVGIRVSCHIGHQQLMKFGITSNLKPFLCHFQRCAGHEIRHLADMTCPKMCLHDRWTACTCV